MAFDLTARQAFHAKMRFGHLVVARPLARDELPVLRDRLDVVGEAVGVLQEQAAGDEPHVHALLLPVAGSCRRRRFFLSLKHLERGRLEVGRDDDLGEDVAQVLGHLERDGAVGGDDAAERRHRVALVRAQVGARDRVERVRRGDRDAARVRVLDDRDGGLDQVERRAQGRIGIDVVVVRHLLALQLRRLRDAVAAETRV